MAQSGDPKSDPKSFTCDENSIQWERTGFSAPAMWDATRNVRPSAGFFNRGQKNWPLIAQNRPVAAGAYWASASPLDATLSTGSTPLSQGFRVTARNEYGISVVAIGYQFLVQTGGGSGASARYITRLEIAPTQVDVAWGWNVDLTVVLQNPGEYGEPGASFAVLQAQLELNINTEIKKVQQTGLYLIFPQGIVTA